MVVRVTGKKPNVTITESDNGAAVVEVDEAFLIGLESAPLRALAYALADAADRLDAHRVVKR